MLRKSEMGLVLAANPKEDIDNTRIAKTAAIDKPLPMRDMVVSSSLVNFYGRKLLVIGAAEGCLSRLISRM